MKRAITLRANAGAGFPQATQLIIPVSGGVVNSKNRGRKTAAEKLWRRFGLFHGDRESAVAAAGGTCAPARAMPYNI